MLCEYLPPLEAYEQRAAVEAAVAPHMERWAYGELVWDLRDAASALYPPPEPVEREIYEHPNPDPVKAAAWFRSIGARVVGSDGNEIEVETA